MSLYNKAKKQRPDKPTADYLKLILITKPPFDYCSEKIIESILFECQNIDDLSDYIASNYKESYLWKIRENNRKFNPMVKERNEQFFREFWDG